METVTTVGLRLAVIALGGLREAVLHHAPR